MQFNDKLFSMIVLLSDRAIRKGCEHENIMVCRLQDMGRKLQQSGCQHGNKTSGGKQQHKHL